MLPGKRAFSKASAAKADPAVELTNDDMSQLSCQTQHHMNTVSSSTLSDEDMLDDEQAYLSNSRSYRGRPAQSSSASTVSASTTFGLGANATASGSHSQQAPYRCTDNQQATDRCTDSQHPSHACTDTSQASHRHTDAAEMVASAPSPFKLARSRQQYLRDVEACQKALHDGDSYEICLTTALVREHSVDPLQLYRTLRRVNPAPYAAWLSFGGAEEHQICCASPERFLKVSVDTYTNVFCRAYAFSAATGGHSIDLALSSCHRSV